MKNTRDLNAISKAFWTAITILLFAIAAAMVVGAFLLDDAEVTAIKHAVFNWGEK